MRLATFRFPVRNYLLAVRKPLIAAINGHAPAGGCMLCLAADQRVMVDEKATIGLNLSRRSFATFSA